MSVPQNKDSILRVHHMLDFADKAVRFTRGKNREDLDSDEILATAVIHLIEMLGEASRNIPGELQQRYPDIPWEQISGTRNRLAHGYFEVDLDIIWTIITQDIPPLTIKLRKILKNEE
jgi:uncharacterized protein with HEPN domain